MVRKADLERKTITELTVLCIERGLDPTGEDKDTLIARLLGKEKTKPEPEPEPKPEPEPEPGPES